VREQKTAKKEKLNAQEILNDYQMVVTSREASLIGRKEVFMGKAKFGIFGDGKELAQVAMSKVFRNGDFRSGYYRDQTFMMAIGGLTVQEYFAQLYAHMSVEAEPASAGRMMNGHFANRLLDEQGQWKVQTEMKNSSADISPTAGQMPRLLGLAYASKLYRQNKELADFTHFSKKGNEIAFGTIGNASTSEGHFFESINAAGVLQVPLVMSVWDDDYGISVPKEYHTTGGSISDFLSGMQRKKGKNGFEILRVKGWDYEALIAAYTKAEKIARKEHVPVFIHVAEITQPQGHSTSGSHERYKSKERLEWERAHDCNLKFKEWIIDQGIADEEELAQIEKEAKEHAKQGRVNAWNAFIDEIKEEQAQAVGIMEALSQESKHGGAIIPMITELKKTMNPIRLDTVKVVKKVLRLTRTEETSSRQSLLVWLERYQEANKERFNSHVMSESPDASLNVEAVAPVFTENSPLVDGREVLQACFDAALARDPRVFAIGEDVGKIGDVNQAFAGLQEKYGINRVTDTGIRETTIIGQGIGAAMRGLRPITEIQYLDYLLYAIQTLSDDLATLQYRTKGGQKAPLIIRTRGHRLEGVWHSGSPIGMILNSLRGINVLVPRNMTQAAGFYNTMLASDDPALIIECLNGYRLKERIPDNIGDFKVPVGVPEVIREGRDITVVTYGSMCRVVLQAAQELEEVGVSVEVIDVQSLLPFDVHHSIIESVKKTNRVVFADEDVPGGASAFMMQKVVEEQGAYRYLDAQPTTISAQEHRPAYASDGDYWSKPNVETIFDSLYDIMSEADPQAYPTLY
jgi:pyruvate/2-oxoglutarate/acetoin dehydrogenase E1 component/TPP-dependent pyruvate/acetoin dehydrogenase alpha subunit